MNLLSVPKNQCAVMHNEEIKDSMHVRWNHTIASKLLFQSIQNVNITDVKEIL